jgi:hypothetical protein
MSYTWGQLKTDVRAILFPSGEAPNLVTPHDTAFLHGILDLQQFVPCLQQDHTDVVPACSSFYRCGITMFNAPRGFIKRVSVIGSDPSGDPDYCKEVEYRQIAPHYIRGWLQRHGRDERNGFLDLPAFFALDPCLCRKAMFPVPTDSGLPAGLAPLQLGAHYAQGSTDRPRRSRAGVWAVERGVLQLAPWINVEKWPETVLILWDGIKRTWSDSDPVDPDPLLGAALEEFVRADHARKFDRDFDVAQAAEAAYFEARKNLWHNCRNETRTREREPAMGRSSVATLESSGVLYYNDTPYTANYTATTADCPTGETAAQSSSASYTVQAGSVSSTVSVADADTQAQTLAQNTAKTNAIAGLTCTGTPTGGGTTTTPGTYSNPGGSKVVVTCASTASDAGDPNAPTPTGTSATGQTVAGSNTSTVSAADAESQAVKTLTDNLKANLICCYLNSTQTGQPANCTTVLPPNPAITAPAQTTPAGTSSCTQCGPASAASTLQTAANTAAMAAANTAAVNLLPGLGCPSTIQAPGNTQQGYACWPSTLTEQTGLVQVCVTVAVGSFPTNALAQTYAQTFAQQYWFLAVKLGLQGQISLTYPGGMSLP